MQQKTKKERKHEAHKEREAFKNVDKCNTHRTRSKPQANKISFDKALKWSLLSDVPSIMEAKQRRVSRLLK